MEKANHASFYGLFAVLTIGFLVSAAPASAETTQCTAIPFVPVTINTQGIYCLTKNLATNMSTGAAIFINVNNVTIDMNGYKIGNLAARAGTQAYGIFASQRKKHYHKERHHTRVLLGDMAG